LRGVRASVFTRLHFVDFFFDGAKSRFSSSPQFFFLRPFARFGFEVTALLFGATPALFLFCLPERR
jgi:hypothetical protein